MFLSYLGGGRAALLSVQMLAPLLQILISSPPHLLVLAYILSGFLVYLFFSRFFPYDCFYICNMLKKKKRLSFLRITFRYFFFILSLTFILSVKHNIQINFFNTEANYTTYSFFHYFENFIVPEIHLKLLLCLFL